MAKRIVADSLSEPNEAGLLRPDLLQPGLRHPDPVHVARSFPDLPRREESVLLLAELANSPCAFSPVAAEKPLALYGAGDMGRLARDFFALAGLNIALVIDRNAGAASVGAWSATRPVTPEAVPEETKRSVRVAVCVATSAYVPIEAALHEAGFTDVVPFYDLSESFRHLHPLSNGWFAPPFTAQEQDETSAALAAWDDDASRAHHLQFLAWRRLREEWVFAPAPPLTGDSRYFIPEVLEVLRDDEIFVDGGAYDGCITEAFDRRMGGLFQRIVAIEPDGPNRVRCEANVRTSLAGDARVTIHGFALAERDGAAPFHEGLGYASQLSATGHTSIECRSLDELGLKPTFVKLHLEGGELAALKGAKETLVSHRPLVAVTVYHNADGLWKTARWLMQILPDYRFLFRIHAWCGTGAVIYAIPNERRGRSAGLNTA